MVRSRSSSSSSLDFIASEAVLCLKFADTYGRRAGKSDARASAIEFTADWRWLLTVSDVNIGPCLWVGTELGSVLVLTFQLPSSSFSASVASSLDPSQPQATHRLSQPVIGVPTGSFLYTTQQRRCITMANCRYALPLQQQRGRRMHCLAGCTWRTPQRHCLFFS